MHMPKGSHPNSLAQLRPIQPGHTLNPGGRPRNIRTPQYWLVRLQDLTVGDLREVFEDGSQPASKRIAARLMLTSLEGELKQGALDAANAVMDRTGGKPTQQIQMETKSRKSAKQLIAQIKRKYRLYDRRQGAPGPNIVSEAAGDAVTPSPKN